MFSKAQLGLVWWPVTLASYDEAGEVVEQKIRVLFKPLTRAERAARQRETLLAANAALVELKAEVDLSRAADETATVERLGVEATERVMARLDQAFTSTEADVATLIARTHDWRGVEEEGTAVPFTRELLLDLMAYDAFARPMLAAFDACSEGAVRKNSEPGHAGIPAQAQA